MLQAPGPRGSPHAPHAPGPLAALIGRSENDFAGVLDCAAKTDISFCRSAPWHAGHDGDWPSRVRYSKRLPQPRHSYSKRGIRYSNADIADFALRVADCGLGARVSDR